MPPKAQQIIPTKVLREIRDNAWDDTAMLLFHLLAYAGLRRQEIIELRWSDIDFGGNWIVVDSGNNPRMVPMHPALKKQLARASGASLAGPVLTTPTRETKPSIATFERWVVELCQGTGYSAQDFRYTVAASLARNGVPEPTINQILGWQNTSTSRFGDYTVPQEELQRAIRRLYQDDPL